VSADWWAPALFCIAEQNSSEVKRVRGSGMLGMSVLEDLSVRLCCCAGRRAVAGRLVGICPPVGVALRHHGPESR